MAKLTEAFQADPIMMLGLVAALIALASTPIAFAVLGRLQWFEARRGRVMLRPSFTSIIVGMMLVMGIPAIFAALVLKSRHWDQNRYEFDPNKHFTVLDQGARFKTADEANKAAAAEYDRLAEERKNLVDGMKKLDEAMLAMRAATGQSPATAQALPPVLERLATIRRAVGLDGPQQLMDFTAPPAALPPTVPMVVAGATAPTPTIAQPNAMAPASIPNATNANPPPAAATGLGKATADAELATVPDPQKAIAAMLPLAEVPAGWVATQYGPKHLETFNADNLFEKIDGRAESFTQNNVSGMAYASYHPQGDDANEVQVYIFEFDHTKPLRAKSKYNSEKPEELKLVDVGTEGYTAAGSLLFFVDPYYTQIVSTQDDPKFAAFALEVARGIAAKQGAGSSADGATGGGKKPASMADVAMGLLPKEPHRGEPNLAAQDVFGFSFLTDVFAADYKEDAATWQGFIRPYATDDEAKAIFAKYQESAASLGGSPKLVPADGADQFMLSSSLGITDAIFRKGNVIGGVNGATDAAKAEAFARAFARSLPADLPKAPPAAAEPAPKPKAEGDGGGEGGDK